MKKTLLCLSVLAVLGHACISQAAESFRPERIGVEKTIKPGPNVYVMDQSWSGATNITFLSADNLKTKGSISTGLIAQMDISMDKKSLYTASTYPKRIVWGPIDAVVQKFDIQTASLAKEMETLPKMAEVSANINSFKLSHNNLYAFVQNATPAASVSVIDLETGKNLLEVPTPGCWAIYPSDDDKRFSSLCGDGTVTSYQLSDDLKSYTATKSDKIFDAVHDPLFITAQRDGDNTYFTSFNGNIYVLNDKQAKVTLVNKFNYNQGIKGHWVPGGFEILAFNKPSNLLFVAMHPNGHEGSHKDGAKEVWGINMATHKVVTRVKVKDPISIAVSQTPSPVLFTLSEGENNEGGTVDRYTFSGPNMMVKHTGEVKGLGTFNQILMVDY